MIKTIKNNTKKSLKVLGYGLGIIFNGILAIFLLFLGFYFLNRAFSPFVLLNVFLGFALVIGSILPFISLPMLNKKIEKILQ